MSVESEFFTPEPDQQDESSQTSVFSEVNYSALDTKEFRELYNADLQRFKDDSAENAAQIQSKHALASNSREFEVLNKISINNLKMGKYLEQLRSKGEYMSPQEGAMSMGIIIGLLDGQKERIEIAQRTNAYEQYKESVNRVVLFPCASAVIRFGELSLYELSKKDIDQIPAHIGYTFILDGLHQRPSGTYGVPENTGISQEYPALLYEGMENVANYIDALDESNLDAFEKRFGMLGGYKGTAAKHTSNLMHKISAIRKKVHETITDPNSIEFPQLKQVLEQYMNDENINRLDSVYYMTNQQNNEYIEFYRTIDNLRLRGVYPEFYSNIIERLNETNTAYLQDEKLISFNELQSIIRTPANNDKSIEKPYSVGSVIEAANDIMSQSRLREFRLGKGDVSFGNIQDPENTIIKFNVDDSKKITISFTFSEMDSKSLLVSYDERSQSFDWHLMQEMDTETKQMIVAESQLVLKAVQSQIEQEREQKREAQREKAQRMQELQSVRRRRSGGKGKKTRPKVVYPKAEKPEVGPLSFIDQELESEVVQEPEKRTVPPLIIPDEEHLEELLDRVSETDKRLIKERFERYNEEGLGYFKPLMHTTADGDGLYSLRVGENRVITRLVEQPDGSKAFVIENIGPRGVIYRSVDKDRL